MQTILAGIVLLGILVFIHELGHFLVAKMCGVRVLTFSLGFGPKIAGFQWGETEYKVSILPLGGFVRMFGENPEEELTEEEKSIFDLLKKTNPIALDNLKEQAGLSNKKWDKALKGLAKKGLTKVEKNEEGLWVNLN